MKPHAEIAEHCLSLHRTIAVKEARRAKFTTNGVAFKQRRILTTYHAVEDATALTVDDHPAKCIDCDWSKDFAIVQVAEKWFQPVPIICEPPVFAEPVFVVITRRGKRQTVSGKLHDMRTQQPYWRIAPELPLKQGDSGSPIFTFDGILVGIVQMVETANPGCLPSTGGKPGDGYFIPLSVGYGSLT